MKTHTNKKLVLLLLIISLFMVSCGKSKTAISSDDTSSSSSSTSTTKPIAECNRLQATFIQADIQLYNDVFGLKENTIRMKVQAVDSSFDNNSKAYIQFFRWEANYTGATTLDPTPLPFKLELRSGGGILLSDSYTKIDKPTLQALASKYGLSGTTMQELYNQVNIVIGNLEINYNALKIATYDGTNTAVVAQVDGLIPAFFANPTDYATDPSGQARAPVLMSLHPFISELYQGWDVSHYTNAAKKFCFEVSN